MNYTVHLKLVFEVTTNSYLHPVSRFLIAFIFLASGAGKAFAFSPTATMMSSVGFPSPSFFLACAILIELFGGAGLLLGFRSRYAAAALIVFLIPATLIFHAQFAGDPVSGQEQIAHTLKNLAIIGGLLKFVADGGGDYSLDDRIERKEILI